MREMTIKELLDATPEERGKYFDELDKFMQENEPKIYKIKAQYEGRSGGGWWVYFVKADEYRTGNTFLFQRKPDAIKKIKELVGEVLTITHLEIPDNMSIPSLEKKLIIERVND